MPAAAGMPALIGGDGSGPGWDAITAAAREVHGEEKPVLLQKMNDPRATGIGKSDAASSSDALDAVAAYRVMEPFSHWHYIGYGLTDLYGDTAPTDAPAADTGHAELPPSGLGAELTFRLADPGAFDPGSQPPMWPVDLLHNLARWIRHHNAPIVPGDILEFGGPIDGDATTKLVGFLAITDPQLEHRDTPAGHLDFVQLVGATQQDLEDARAWHVQGVVDLFSEVMGLGLTDVTRPSVRELPGCGPRIDAGILQAHEARESAGSSAHTAGSAHTGGPAPR